jgi:hypothetical protein
MADQTRATFTLDPGGIADAVTPVFRQVVEDFLRKTAAQAKVNTPVRTGFLGRSIEEEPVNEVSPLRFEGGVTATAHYAAAVHEGTRPHVIRPRRAGGVLAFDMGGRTVFARSVNHPGTRARPFLLNAANTVAGQMLH